MIEKIKNYVLGDTLFFQKAGLLIGAAFGVIVGFVISDKADGYEIEQYEALEEVPDGETETD